MEGGRVGGGGKKKGDLVKAGGGAIYLWLTGLAGCILTTRISFSGSYQRRKTEQAPLVFVSFPRCQSTGMNAFVLCPQWPFWYTGPTIIFRMNGLGIR